MTTSRRRASSRPTEAELEIMHILWQMGSGTVREVYEAMGNDNAYTTVLKLLQVMHGKGLVVRDDSQRAHVFSPAYSKDETQTAFVNDLVKRVFEGSPSELVLQALGSNPPASAEDRARIRSLLDALEGDETDDTEKRT